MIETNAAFQFKQQFDLLSNNTKEYDITVPYIVRDVISRLPNRTHFIDIGAGRGNLAKPLSQYFLHTTIVEPNQHFCQELLDWAQRSGCQLKAVCGTWQDAEPAIDQADFILMSHMLYYVPRQEWARALLTAYNCLNPGASIVIILNLLTNGVTDLYKHFLAPGEWQEIASAEGIKETLHSAGFADISTIGLRTQIHANTAQEAHELIDFLLLGRVSFNTPELNQRRAEYAETVLKQGSRYAIRSDCGVLTVSKPRDGI